MQEPVKPMTVADCALGIVAAIGAVVGIRGACYLLEFVARWELGFWGKVFSFFGWGK